MIEHKPDVEGVSILLALHTRKSLNDDYTTSVETLEVEMFFKPIGEKDAYQVRVRHVGGEEHGKLYQESPWVYTAARAADAWLYVTHQYCPYEPKQIAILASDAYLGRLA